MPSRGSAFRCEALRTALTPRAAAALVPDNASVMIGGFMGVGSPHRTIAALVERGVRGLTVIANDTARPGVGIGLLISAGCVAKVIASHIGTNPETQKLMLAGALEVELVPQGTLAERVRAGGSGLGGCAHRDGPRHARGQRASGDRGRRRRLSGRAGAEGPMSL